MVIYYENNTRRTKSSIHNWFKETIAGDTYLTNLLKKFKNSGKTSDFKLIINEIMFNSSLYPISYCLGETINRYSLDAVIKDLKKLFKYKVYLNRFEKPITKIKVKKLLNTKKINNRTYKKGFRYGYRKGKKIKGNISVFTNKQDKVIIKLRDNKGRFLKNSKAFEKDKAKILNSK